MTEQEEIRDILITLCCEAHSKDLSKSPSGFDEEIKDALKELSGAGVAIKVDRELPKPRYPYSEIDAYILEGQQDMLEAGYVAVEPLIKEG